MAGVRFTRRLLVLLSLLALPVLLALASQFLAERPGAPELPSREPVRVGLTGTAAPANPPTSPTSPTSPASPASPASSASPSAGADGSGYVPDEDVDDDGIDDDVDDDIEIVAPESGDD